ncbi:MAG: D-tyrosyl-tRNA(Tyr) deacylase [Opitutus sp.]|nr:D-tyrosyl-tRNA(Tyr) deacylase [Opitutus sp.]
MRVVLQRVARARVTVEGRVTGEIGRGLLLLQGIESSDTAADGEWLAQKIAKLRVFPDDTGQMNRSVADIAGGILLVSQFTLHASTAKGTRPSFNAAARPEIARPLHELFQRQLAQRLGRPVQTGEFGAMMEVSLVNDGPVTLVIDSKTRE